MSRKTSSRTKTRNLAQNRTESSFHILNGIDPEAYLSYVLARIPDYSVNRIAELLPWNVGIHATSNPTAAD